MNYLSIPQWVTTATKGLSVSKSRLLVWLVCCFLCVQSLSAQDQMVKLSAKTLPIGQLFSEIEKQTGYLFVYSNIDLDTQSMANFPKNTGTVSYFISQFAQGKGIKYEITPGKYTFFPNKPKRKPHHSGVSGSISDSKGDPLVGATIQQKDTPKQNRNRRQRPFLAQRSRGFNARGFVYRHARQRSARNPKHGHNPYRQCKSLRRSGGSGLWHGKESRPRRFGVGTRQQGL